MSMTYSLMHINEVCKEHVDNNFRPLPGSLRDSLAKVSAEIVAVLRDADEDMDYNDPDAIDSLRDRCSAIKDKLSYMTRDVYDMLQKGDDRNMTVAYVYLNVLQETQEFVTSYRSFSKHNA